jgi:hypothetical protein
MPDLVISLPQIPVQQLPSVSAFAALRNLPSAGLVSGEDYAVDGSSSFGDGGGGLFVWVPSSTADDDDATIIKPSDLGPLQAGRWLLAGGQQLTDAINAAKNAALDIITAIYDVVILSTDTPSEFKAKWESAQVGILIEAGDYNVPHLSTSVNGLSVRSSGGRVNIYKTVNGPIWTHTGGYFSIHDIIFHGQGAAFTGDNLNFTGQGGAFWNCGSVDAAGRALKSSGYVSIYGSNPTWSTRDISSTGYDIEIGASGTPTLYSQLYGIYTSQATGGLLFIDNGSQIVSGGQFGKYTIQSGTGPAGVNGGIAQGARILGSVTVGLSNAVFSGNQFGAVPITFGAGTSGCSMDASNVYEVGCTITNNGNINNFIMRNVGTGAGGLSQIGFGPDAAQRVLGYVGNDPTIGWQPDAAVVVPNGQAFRSKNNAASGFVNLAYITGANDNVNLGDNTAGFTSVQGGPGGVYFGVGGATIFHASATSFNPQLDNACSLGLSGQRWNTVYAATATINTSDGNAKQDIRALNDAEHAVAVEVKGLFRAFRMKDAVAKKGDSARIHFGVIAQEVATAFANHGLDAHRYGLFCYDEWEDQEAIYKETADGDLSLVAPAVAAGSRYGIRYAELHAFMLGAL